MGDIGCPHPTLSLFACNCLQGIGLTAILYAKFVSDRCWSCALLQHSTSIIVKIMHVSTVVVLLLVCCAWQCCSGVQSSDPTPIQHRIALSPGGMAVSWSTKGAFDSVTPTVAYGLSSLSLDMNATGETSWYYPSTTWFHHVVLRGLTPDTQYYWQVTAPAPASSAIFSFVTAPPVGSNQTVSIAIYGDMGPHSSVIKWQLPASCVWQLSVLTDRI